MSIAALGLATAGLVAPATVAQAATSGASANHCQVVEESMLAARAAIAPPAPPVAPAAEPGTPCGARTRAGVVGPLIPVVQALTTEDQLLGLVDYAPQLTGEVLLALCDKKSSDEVFEQVTAPVATPEPVDTADFQGRRRTPGDHRHHHRRSTA